MNLFRNAMVDQTGAMSFTGDEKKMGRHMLWVGPCGVATDLRKKHYYKNIVFDYENKLNK